jgi:hypothetical protein
MTIQTITAEIISGKLTNEDLSSIIDSVRYARARLQKSTIRALRLGDSVEFTSAKTGKVMSGFVTKIAIKYVTVNTGTGLWRVPANMLTVTDQEYA